MAYRNIGIYRDSETIRYHLDHFTQHTPNQWAVADDLGHFLNSENPVNIGFLHLPFPFSADTQNKLDTLRNKCDHVFVIGSELHNVTCDFIRANDYNNITYYLCGRLNFELVNASVGEYYDWFETSRYFYKTYLPEILGRIKHQQPKPAGFDILLGRKKLHRDQVFNFVKNNLRVEDYVMTYFNEHQISFDTGHDQWRWEETGLRFIDTPKWTVDRVEYFGHRMSLSQVIPIEIYNQTNYSVIAETNFNKNYSFYTEKTSKPIIARRLFVMFGGQHYLRNLRELGFQTFGSVIDESYDDIENDIARWQAACEQVKYLCQQDSAEILAKIQPVVDHNFNVMMNTDWHLNFVRDLESRVDKLVQQI